MTTPGRGALAALATLAALAAPAEAIIIRHDRPDARYVELGRRYPSVCRVETRVGERAAKGEGTLVRPGWVLTAAHVVRTPVPEGGRRLARCGGVEYPVAEVLRPDRTSDIALLRLERPVRGIRPVPEYAGRDEKGMRVTFVGRGVTGTGLTGPRPVPRDTLTRGATNRIDRVSEGRVFFTFDGPGSRDATDLEGVSGPGDSGGPAFVTVRGRTYVAGVSGSGDDTSGDGITGTYGDAEIYARVSTFAGWIRETAGGS